MATSEQYAEWIVANQAKKGTPEFETVAQAYRVSRQAKPAEAPQFERDARNPAAGMSGVDQFRAGAGKALVDIGRGVKQFVNLHNTTEAPKIQAEIDEAKKLDASLMNTGAGMAGNIVGNVAATAIPGIGLQGAATRAAASVLPAAIAPTVAAAGTGAAITAATEPVASDESRGQKTAYGAIGGAAGDVAARGLARVAQPIMQSPAVRRLLDEGIVPTPGQAAGANSFIGKMEQRLQSIPLVGDLVTGGRNRATAEFNEAALNRAMPDGARVQGIGRGAVQQVEQVLSDGYNDVLRRIGTVNVQPQFLNAVRSTMTDPDLSLSLPMQQRLEQIVRGQILDRGAALNADLAKRADANLGMFARGFSTSQDADQRMLGRALRDVQGAWRQNITANAGAAEVADLRELNRAFANFVRVERAAGSRGAAEGVFSPKQLEGAVRAMDTSSRRGQFARGESLMQDLTDAGVPTLSHTVPNSGTPERAMLAMAAGGAGANEYFGGPGYLSMLAASPLVYSRAGSRYMVGDLPAQTALSELLRRTAPAASQVGRAISD